jgi:hypothetical protein
MVAGDDPPEDVPGRAHGGGGLAADLFRRAGSVKEVAGDQHMAGAVVPRGLSQAGDYLEPRLDQAAAQILGHGAEPFAKMQVRAVDETKSHQIFLVKITSGRQAGPPSHSDLAAGGVKTCRRWRPLPQKNVGNREQR